MKKVVFAVCFAAAAIACQAQESLTDYNFLRLPVSAHVAALGGDKIGRASCRERVLIWGVAV